MVGLVIWRGEGSASIQEEQEEGDKFNDKMK